MIDKNDILGLIEMDEGAKKVFLRMNREEQLLAILGMLAFIRAELTKAAKAGIELKRDIENIKQDNSHYRRIRELKEEEMDAAINSIIRETAPTIARKMIEEGDENTTQKVVREIGKVFATRFDAGKWFVDKVLPQLITVIILGILALVFANRIP